MTTPEPQYEDYVDLIRHEAWKRVSRNPLVDFEELVSLGSLAFDKAIKTWDQSKGKFSTHLFWQIKDQMGRVQGCRNYVTLDEPECIQIADETAGPFEETKFRSGLASLSQEALEVVYLVLKSPEELIDWTIRWIRPSQSSILMFLQGLGWKPKKIEKVFGEIKTMLKEL